MIRRCIICGAEFSTPPSNNKRTCSPACSSQWRSKQHMGVSNRWSEGAKAAARAAAAKTGNLKNGMAAAMNLPERISIHAPLAGCDSDSATAAQSAPPFQSTHPLRGATCNRAVIAKSFKFQSTHPLRGATLTLDHNFRADIISIHAPLAGCDALPGLWHRRLESFQSTHPLRGATGRVHGREAHPGFQSTHPLRGATPGTRRPAWDQSHFNPRTPCGVRRIAPSGG